MIAQLREEGFDDDSIRWQRSIDMRYRRQVHIVTVPVAEEGPVTAETIERTVAGFEDLYREKYGEDSAYREAGIELIGFRFRGEGVVGKPRLQVEAIGSENADHAIVEQVPWVDKAGAVEELPGYDFDRLAPGNRLLGPAIVWTPITTLVVAPRQSRGWTSTRTSSSRRGAEAVNRRRSRAEARRGSRADVDPPGRVGHRRREGHRARRRRAVRRARRRVVAVGRAAPPSRTPLAPARGRDRGRTAT